MRLLFFLLFFVPGSALAIVNIEALDVSPDGDGWQGRVGIAVKGASGNTDKVNAELDGRLIRRRGQYFDMLTGSFNYGKSKGVRDTNNSFLHLRHRYALNESWGLEAFAQAQKNEFARLKLRTLLGGGIRRSWLGDRTTLHLGLGSFFENETLRPGTVAAASTRLWRGNAYMAWHYSVGKRVRLQNTLYFQPAWSDFGDQRLFNAAALRVAITGKLDIRMAVELTYDSRPPVAVRATDISYATGLEFRF
jgi:putative salt-induced outer membrane protein YdiY